MVRLGVQTAGTIDPIVYAWVKARPRSVSLSRFGVLICALPIAPMQSGRKSSARMKSTFGLVAWAASNPQVVRSKPADIIAACHTKQNLLLRSRSPSDHTTVELVRTALKGLLSPALSSKGGEGDRTANSFDKSPNSMAVASPQPSTQGE